MKWTLVLIFSLAGFYSVVAQAGGRSLEKDFLNLLEHPSARKLSGYKKLCDARSNFLPLGSSKKLDAAIDRILKENISEGLEALLYSYKCTDAGYSESLGIDISNKVLMQRPLETIQTTARLQFGKDTFEYGLNWGKPEHYRYCNLPEGGTCTDKEKKTLLDYEQERIDIVTRLMPQLSKTERELAQYIVNRSKQNIEELRNKTFLQFPQTKQPK